MWIKRVLSLGAIAVMVLSGVALAQDPVPLYPRNYTVLIENDRVRVMDFRLRKGDTERFHSHPAHVLYVLEPFKIRFKLSGGGMAVRETKAGEVLFSEAVTHSPTNIGESDAHGILIELKTTGAAGSDASAANAGSQGGKQLTARDLAEALTAVTFIRGKPGKEADVKRELLSLTTPTRAEPGNLAYDLYQSVDHPGQFMRLEVWRNAQALELHKASPYLRASFERRKDQGWQTEITRWTRVAEDVEREP